MLDWVSFAGSRIRVGESWVAAAKKNGTIAQNDEKKNQRNNARNEEADDDYDDDGDGGGGGVGGGVGGGGGGGGGGNERAEATHFSKTRCEILKRKKDLETKKKGKNFRRERTVKTRLAAVERPTYQTRTQNEKQKKQFKVEKEKRGRSQTKKNIEKMRRKNEACPVAETDEAAGSRVSKIGNGGGLTR